MIDNTKIQQFLSSEMLKNYIQETYNSTDQDSRIEKEVNELKEEIKILELIMSEKIQNAFSMLEEILAPR